MKALGIFFVVVLLGVLATGGYWGVKFVVDLFAVLDSQTAVLVALASVVVVICVATINWGFTRIGQKEVRAQMRLEKINLYERVMLLWRAKLKNRTTSIDPAREDELQQLAQLLTLRGSSRVIKAYLDLHMLEKTVGLLTPDISSRFVTMQMEMRKDLGLSVQDLKREDFLQLCFADVAAAPEPGKLQPRQDLHPHVSLTTNT